MSEPLLPGEAAAGENGGYGFAARKKNQMSPQRCDYGAFQQGLAAEDSFRGYSTLNAHVIKWDNALAGEYCGWRSQAGGNILNIALETRPQRKSVAAAFPCRRR